MPKKLITIACVFFICSSILHGVNLDSTNVMKLHNKAYSLELSHPRQALVIYDSAAIISHSINYTIGEGRSYNYMAIVNFEQGEYLNAKSLNLKAIPLFRSINYQLGVAACLINLGNIELYLGNYDASMDYYIEGIEIYEKLDDHQRLMWTYNNMSSLFLNNQQGQKSLEYALKAKQRSAQINDSIGLADSYINLANASLMNKDSIAFRNYSNQAYWVSQSTSNLYNQLLASNNLANHFIQSNSLDSAAIFTKKTIELADQYNNPYNKSESLLTAGKLAYKQDRFMPALVNLEKANELANTYKLDKLRLNIAHQSYLVNKAANNHQQASADMALYAQLKDSINRVETLKYIHLLEQKFENTKKEQTIQSQKAELATKEQLLSRNRMLFIAIGIILILLGIVIYYLKRYNKQVSKLHSEQVKRLKVEQKNTAIKALVDGQEQERIRLARELHDGVNGGLAAIKLLASNHKNGSAKDSLIQIDELLLNLSQEVREMSHNLMPGTLAKGGLNQSINDLVNRLNQSENLEFDVQYIGAIDDIPDATKFYSYRIIQELLQNVLKHSKATECLLQVSVHDTAFNICCEDNGVGMDTKLNGNGIGMKNINGRLEFLNGTMDYQSKPNEGTSINIEIPIEV